MKVVTYVTRVQGKFEELVNNEHGVHVEVLGMGNKWNGYMDKIRGVYEYIENLPDEEIVVYLDGFDTLIKKPLDGLEEKFKKLNCGVLISRDIDHGDSGIRKKFTSDFFGTCHNGITASAGMFMGYVSYLKVFLRATLDQDTDDDQQAFNSLCHYFSFIKTDDEYTIFYNVKFNYFTENSDSDYPEGIYFLSFPGSPTLERRIRSVKDYGPHIIKRIFNLQVVAVLILILVAWYFWKSA